MLLTYVDESYSTDWYYMAALLCDGPGVLEIGKALDGIIRKTSRKHGMSHNAELHGYELFQGAIQWTGVPPRVRIGVYNAAFEAIAEHCDAIILRGVHSAGLRERYSTPDPPHSIVLMHLLEQIDSYAKQRDDLALVIADEVGEQAKHRNDLAFYRDAGTWGYKSTKLTRIVDTLHFAPSRASRLIQAIDLITFLYRRIESHAEPNKKAERANKHLWGHIEPKVVHKWCWKPI